MNPYECHQGSGVLCGKTWLETFFQAITCAKYAYCIASVHVHCTVCSIGTKLTVIHWEMLYTRTCLFWRKKHTPTHFPTEGKCKLTTSQLPATARWRYGGIASSLRPPDFHQECAYTQQGELYVALGLFLQGLLPPTHTLLRGWTVDGQDNWHVADFESGLSAVAGYTSCPQLM
jgi:hypothetical protein